MVCLHAYWWGWSKKETCKTLVPQMGSSSSSEAIQAIEQQIANPGSDGTVCQIAGTCDFSTTRNGNFLSLSARVNMILEVSLPQQLQEAEDKPNFNCNITSRSFFQGSTEECLSIFLHHTWF